MTPCNVAPDTAEQYVSGMLTDSEQAAFEDHFFACDSCLQRVQALQRVQGALAALPPEAASPAQPSRRVPPMTLMALAAMLVLSVIVWRLPRQAEETTDVPAPAAATDAARPAAPAIPPASAPEPIEDPIVRMGRITPPPYVAITTRSEADPDAQAFANAMRHYAGGRFDQSSAGLRVLVTGAPGLAHAQFFLGVSELMANRPEPAREAFERTIRTGVAPYADEAHFYLAKAALRMKDVDTARGELRLAIDREAGPRGEAARLLGELTPSR